MHSYCVLSVDYEDDEWPEDIGGESGVTTATTSRMTSSAGAGSACALAATETESVKRMSSLKRTEAVICNIGAMLAGFAVGFDVRTNIHPRTDSAATDVAAKFRPVAGSEASKDLAVGQQHPQHHTYHGTQTRYRPTVNFNLPIRFAQSLSYEGDYSSGGHSDSFTTPSSDHHTTPSASDSRRTTPSLSGRSFFSAESGSLQSPGPPSNRPSVADSASFSADLALISLSPSTDEAFVECQRQFSADSSSSGWAVVDTSTWGRCRSSDSSGVAQTPAGGSNYASPAAGSSYCLASDALPTAPEAEDSAGSQCLAGIPSPICPPPVMTRRPIAHEQHAQAERPVTLDIIPRPRPLPGILKNVSPMHVVTPYSGSPRSRVTPSRVTPGSEGSVGQSPYHVANHHRRPSLSTTDQRKTLLDIDVEGQTADSTKPLSVTRLAQEPDT